MTCGIYCIENNVNSKKYIGKSVDIEKRWLDHKWRFKNKIHDNKHLEKSWVKYGEKEFSFYIIEECLPEVLSEREMFYISSMKTKENGYNMTFGGDGKLGYAHTEETKKAMSEKAKGRTISKEQVEKRLGTISNWSTERKAEFHEKSSNSHKGKPRSQETKDKLSKYFSENPSRKKGEYSPTDETRKKISIALKKYRESVRKEALV